MSSVTSEKFGFLRRVDILLLLGALVALFVALGNEPWWTLRGASTSNLLSIQVSPFYLHINALGLPSTLPTANSLGSFTRVLLILGSLALLAASLHPTAWWRNLAVYLGLSSLAELYFSFVMIYYWAETAIVQAYGVVPPYDGTASLQANILGLVFKGNPRLITQLVTQMGTATNYESVVRVALNLEQAISIADTAQPHPQFIPHGPPASNVSNW